MLLFANENQNARCQRQNSHYDCRDSDVEQQSDSGENKVDSEEQHSEVLGDVHGLVLRQAHHVCTLNFKPRARSSLWTGQELRRSFRVETFCPLEQWWQVRRVISRDRSPRNSTDKGVRDLSLSLTR